MKTSTIVAMIIGLLVGLYGYYILYVVDRRIALGAFLVIASNNIGMDLAKKAKRDRLIDLLTK